MATNNVSRPLGALRAAGLIIGCAVLAGPLLAASATMAGGDTVGTPAQWRAQKLDFTYAGFTAFYTCEGMESKVRTILLTLGARNDAKVQAIGCDRASNKPNKIVWVKAEFSTLAPAADGAAPGDTVQAAWSKVQIAPNRPTEMGQGECELVEQLRPMIEKDFTLRNTEYRTSCVPKQVSVADYNVKSDVLRLVAPIAN
jgi:hypothetical protein